MHITGAPVASKGFRHLEAERGQLCPSRRLLLRSIR
jgi:hypothetical protein